MNKIMTLVLGIAIGAVAVTVWHPKEDEASAWSEEERLDYDKCLAGWWMPRGDSVSCRAWMRANAAEKQSLADMLAWAKAHPAIAASAPLSLEQWKELMKKQAQESPPSR
jgi:hypothetical protein